MLGNCSPRNTDAIIKYELSICQYESACVGIMDRFRYQLEPNVSFSFSGAPDCVVLWSLVLAVCTLSICIIEHNFSHF